MYYDIRYIAQRYYGWIEREGKRIVDGHTKKTLCPCERSPTSSLRTGRASFSSRAAAGSRWWFLASLCADRDQYERHYAGLLVGRAGPGAWRPASIWLGRTLCRRGLALLFATPARSPSACCLADILDHRIGGGGALFACYRATAAGGDGSAHFLALAGGQRNHAMPGLIRRRASAGTDIF